MTRAFFRSSNYDRGCGGIGGLSYLSTNGQSLLMMFCISAYAQPVTLAMSAKMACSWAVSISAFKPWFASFAMTAV